VAPPNTQKYPFIVPLKVSQSFLAVGAVCALVVVWFVASKPVFFFFSIFLFENYSLALLVVGISTLIFFFSHFSILALL